MPEPETRVALECADCGYIALTMEEAESHETPDHGGWDTTRVHVASYERNN